LSFVIVSLAILIYKNIIELFIVILFLMAIAVIIAPLELIGGLLKIYDPNSFQRLNIWKTAIEGIYFYPIWGYGAGGFENLFSQLKFPAYDGFLILDIMRAMLIVKFKYRRHQRHSRGIYFYRGVYKVLKI